MLKTLLQLSILLVSYDLSANFELETVLHTQDVENLGESGTDSKSSIDIIGEQELKDLNSSSSSVDDLLKLSPSATTARGPRSSGESPQVRGLDDNKIFVMIDGSRQNFQSGHNSMIAVDTENLKAVKIIKSSANLSYSGSIGGGVNFVTKNPEDILLKNKSTGSEFKFQSSSANSEKVYNAKSVFSKGDSSGLLSLSSASAGNLRLNDNSKLGHSSYNDISGLVKLKYKKIKLSFDYFQREDDSPVDATLNPPDRIVSLFSENKTIKQNVSLEVKDIKTLDLLLYRNTYKRVKLNLESLEESNRSIITTGIKLNHLHSPLKYGGEAYSDHLESDLNGEIIESYPEASGSNYSLFVENEFEVLPSFFVTPGIRHSSYELTAKNETTNKSENALLKKLFTEYRQSQHTISASYSEGFNSPRVNEVYPSGLHSEGDCCTIRNNNFIPNPNLTAETSVTHELGYSFKQGVLSGNALVEFDTNFYNSKINNYIHMERTDRAVWDPEPGDGTTQFVNIKDVSLFGTEVSLKFIYNMFDSKLTYSNIRGKNKTENLYLEDLPADQYNLSLNYYFDRSEVKLGYLGHYSLKQGRVNPNTTQRTDPTDSYIVHNAFINKAFDDFDFNFRVDNLLNSKYRKHASHLYESARDFKISIKYKINTL